jgi:MraZ protein
MFEERSNHTLDQKGRLAIPARFKEVLEREKEDCLMVTKHGECLWAFTKRDWDVLKDQASSLPIFNDDSITFLRAFISGAAKCPIKQGRITIPVSLRKGAGLDKYVAIVGTVKKFEIWNREKWEEELKKREKKLPKASESLDLRF